MGEDSDAEEVKEILTVVADKIPALLTSLTDVLYGKDQAAKYGEAVAGFYSSLKAAGMTDAQAFELTQQYMSSLNIPGMIGKAMSGGFGGGEDNDIGEAIKQKIQQKIEEHE